MSKSTKPNKQLESISNQFDDLQKLVSKINVGAHNVLWYADQMNNFGPLNTKLKEDFVKEVDTLNATEKNAEAAFHRLVTDLKTAMSELKPEPAKKRNEMEDIQVGSVWENDREQVIVTDIQNPSVQRDLGRLTDYTVVLFVNSKNQHVAPSKAVPSYFLTNFKLVSPASESPKATQRPILMLCNLGTQSEKDEITKNVQKALPDAQILSDDPLLELTKYREVCGTSPEALTEAVTPDTKGLNVIQRLYWYDANYKKKLKFTDEENAELESLLKTRVSALNKEIATEKGSFGARQYVLKGMIARQEACLNLLKVLFPEPNKCDIP